MRIIDPRAVPFLALLAFAPFAVADPSLAAQSRQQAALYRAALLRKDFGMLDRDLAPGFSIVYPGGEKTDKARFIADTKGFWGPLKVDPLAVTIDAAKQRLSENVYVWRFVAKGTMRTKGSERSVVKNEAVFALHRVKRGGRWLFDSGRCLKMSTTVDGKPMR